METPSSEASTAAHSHASVETLTPLQPTVSRTHDPNAPDLSFPFRAQAGMTTEYRTISRTGVISGDLAFQRVPSEHAELPPPIRDAEKGRNLKELKLVTFVPNDPEDPRNFSRWYKWCKYPQVTRPEIVL